MRICIVVGTIFAVAWGERAAHFAGVSAMTFHRWMADGAKYESGTFREFREGVRRCSRISRSSPGQVSSRVWE